MEGGFTIPPPTSPTFKPGFKAPGFGFVIPPFPALNLAGVGGGKGQRGAQPQRYTPDLRSVLMGITAPKIPKSYFRGAGGISARPIIKK